jgi:hypothetical protein
MRILIIRGVLVGVLAVPAVARAQTKVILVPSASVSVLSDDNVFSTSSVRSSDQMTLISPGVQTMFETPRARLMGSYAMDMLRSMDFSSLNDLEARRHGMLDAVYRQTSRLSLNLSGHYDRSDEAGELNFETGVLLPRARAMRLELGPSFTYRASPVLTVQGQYNWVQESLEHGFATDEHVGRLIVSRQVSERASISATYVGRRFVNGDGFETSNAVLAGATYKLGPFTTLSVQGGPRRSSATGTRPEVVASFLRRKPNVLTYSVDIWRGESIILGVLGPVEVTSATGRLSIPLRSHVQVGTAAGVFNSESLFQGDARVYHSEVAASWSPKAFYAITASYGADFQHGDIRTSLLNDRDLVRHVFLVELRVAPHVSRTIQPAGPGPARGRLTQESES